MQKPKKSKVLKYLEPRYISNQEIYQLQFDKKRFKIWLLCYFSPHFYVYGKNVFEFKEPLRRNDNSIFKKGFHSL